MWNFSSRVQLDISFTALTREISPQEIFFYICFIGRNRGTLIKKNILKPVGLVVYKDYVYWIDEDTRNVIKVKKYDDSPREIVEAYVDDLSDIAIVDITTSTGKRI